MDASLSDSGPLKIALLEDDLVLRDRILVPGLRNFGFQVRGLETGGELTACLATERFHILVLDVGLPDTDGFTVARQVRATDPGMGIVMLTGRHETPDRVRGLNEGADAYLSKPVELDLLAATLHSLARRMDARPTRSAGWQLDREGWCLLSPAGEQVALTQAERKVMGLLVRRRGEVVDREALIGTLTDNVHDFDPHRLDSLVHRLRRKVGSTAGEALPLTAVHGRGYVFVSNA